MEGEGGLAHTMVYGDGSGNTVTHHYAGNIDKSKKRGNKMACKTKKKPGKK